MIEDERCGEVTRPSRMWGGWVPVWPQAGRAWEGDKLWILIINAASDPPPPTPPASP